MTIWQTIVEAQASKQARAQFTEDGESVQILIQPNGWYEGYVSVS